MSDRSTKANEVKEFIIYSLNDHPIDIGRTTAEKFGLSRVAVANHLKSLIMSGLVEATGQTKARHYKLKILADEKKNLIIDKSLKEDEVWRDSVKPCLEGVKENIIHICAHGFTEMLNNVIDHSESTTASLIVYRDAARIVMHVRDYGVGIFNKIQKALKLKEPQHAILELSKGKITTDKERHSGEGIFFTSRMFDYFAIESGTLIFSRSRSSKTPGDDWLWDSEKAPLNGTGVIMAISTNAEFTTKEIFDNYRAEFDEFGFSKTIIPLVLMKYEGEQLISRSQAKRLMSHVDRFREVILDFRGITEIGQAFADEVFRVYRKENPSIHVYPVNMTNEVKKMIKRITSIDPKDPLNDFITTES